MNQKLTCGFIGLGLIGGSIARALKSFYPDCTLLAYDINPQALKLAVSDNVIDLALTNIDSHFNACKYIFLCAPVEFNDTNLLLVKQYLSPGCILTDVGSVKTNIHTQIKKAGLESCFIGGHPMAGSERTGYANSKALLLENAYYILTPSPGISESDIEALQHLVSSFGAIPLVLTCEQHDYVTAAVSHLPHVVAASLVRLMQCSDSSDGIMKMIAAGGFKDITRIASSSPVMWQQICLTNAENISVLLGSYIASLIEIKQNIDAHDSIKLYDFFDQARDYRDSFINASSGPIKKSYSITIQIADEPGALASIAVLLANHKISIKNIGIAHNREFAEGALRIEFHDLEGMNQAMELLSTKGYVINACL